MTNQRAKVECPTDVLIFCTDPTDVAAFAEPVPLSRSGSVFIPVVITPATMPAITDPQQAAANPELATFSAIGHGDRPDVGKQVLQNWMDAIPALPRRAM